MSNFLKKKIWIIRFEAKRSEKNILIFFLSKIIKWIDKQLTLLLDILIMLLVLPFAWIFNRGKNQQTQRKAYFIGLEHVVDKIVIRGDYFKEQGYEVKYFSFEFSGLRSAKLTGDDIYKFRKFFFFDIFYLLKIFSQKPDYVEFYFEGNAVRQLFVSMLLSRQSVSSCVDRGILEFDKQINVNPFLYGWFRKIVYKRSTLLLVRDPDMYEHLKSLKDFVNIRIVHDYNRVQIKALNGESFNIKQNKQPLRVLFLNGFSVERSPETLVEAMPLVLQENSNVRFIVVGSRNDLERKRVLDVAMRLNVNDYLSLYNWDPNSSGYYDEAVIYVMPAKFIFCNIALLEAMERGLVPIVSNVDKADLIVKDGVNGFVFNDTKEELARKILLLINNYDLRMEMSHNARSTILQNFDISNRMEIIEEELRKSETLSKSKILSEATFH